MGATTSRRTLALIPLLAGGALVFLATSGCSDEARAQRSLKKIVYKEVAQFNKYHQREVKPNVYKSLGSFYRIYHERTDPVVNMRRTNSLDTPYIATLRFTENVYLTRRHTSREDCKRDSHFILSNSNKRELVYAFAGGSWKKKEAY